MSKQNDFTDKLNALKKASEQVSEGGTVSPIQDTQESKKSNRGPRGDWPDQETYQTGIKLPKWVWGELEKALDKGGKHHGKTRNMVIYLAIMEYLRN